MKDKIKGLLVGLIVGMSIISLGASATNGSVIKELWYNNIKITLDGTTVTPTDANGNYVEPFVIDGTTYLPVRAISNALGLNVKWNANTNTVNLLTTSNLQTNVDNLFTDLKKWVVNNGIVYGDYVSYSQSADNYGGNANKNFSLYYWGDTNTIEVCLHSVIDEEYSVNYFIYIPEIATSNYKYVVSYYLRETGEPVIQAEGIIDSSVFTTNYPLKTTAYSGDHSLQNDFMEMARLGICNTLNCLREFLVKENTGYTLKSIGFVNF